MIRDLAVISFHSLFFPQPQLKSPREEVSFAPWESQSPSASHYGKAKGVSVARIRRPTPAIIVIRETVLTGEGHSSAGTAVWLSVRSVLSGADTSACAGGTATSWAWPLLSAYVS